MEKTCAAEKKRTTDNMRVEKKKIMHALSTQMVC